MQVTIYNNQNDQEINTKRIVEISQLLAKRYQVKSQELYIHFVTEKTISEIHRDFFGDPTSTDVITFPIDAINDPKGIWGELFICPKVANDYANEHQIDPTKELELYLIHGILHLMGFDDIEEEDRKKMRTEEKKCIEFLS